MITNNLRTTFRHFAKQKLNTGLHITGLTLGICVYLTIALYILHELSFDAYRGKTSRTYRVGSIWQDGNNRNLHYSTPFPMADALRTSATACENVVSVHPQGAVIDINGDKKFFPGQNINR